MRCQARDTASNAAAVVQGMHVKTRSPGQLAHGVHLYHHADKHHIVLAMCVSHRSSMLALLESYGYA